MYTEVVAIHLMKSQAVSIRPTCLNAETHQEVEVASRKVVLVIAS